jgi:5-methylcytosine-specific restriction endonuclease McrA
MTGWLGTGRFTLQPVLDLAWTDAVDQHDPPAWMRELVMLRDRHCVHPYCHRSARDCDVDHIEAYVEMDDGGPPGQTRPDNLAPLCRRHHRAKTHHGWTYLRHADGSYAWASPQGHRYLVDTRGTVTRF